MDEILNNTAPKTPPRQQNLLCVPMNSSNSLTPGSDASFDYSMDNISGDDSTKHGISTANYTTTKKNPYTHPDRLSLTFETPQQQTTTDTPDFRSASLTSDTGAFVQACTLQLFIITREVSALWPRLCSSSSTYSSSVYMSMINHDKTASTNENHNVNNINIMALIRTCQRLHFEAVELLKAVLRAEGDGALDVVPAPSSSPSPSPSPPRGAALNADEAETLRLRLGRRALWLLARWRQVKASFGIEGQAAAETCAMAGAGAGSGGSDGAAAAAAMQEYEDERHDSGAEI